MKLLLDTNAYSALRRGDDSVARSIRAATHVLVSAVVAGELLYGFRHGNRCEENVRELREFLRSPDVTFLGVTWTTADRFGRIAADLRKQGTPIPTNDIWIAAHAMEHGADLLSFDRHFDHVPGLAALQP
jgi:tRNA(fMet)-specific endonuclease VapC